MKNIPASVPDTVLSPIINIGKYIEESCPGRVEILISVCHVPSFSKVKLAMYMFGDDGVLTALD